MFLQLREIAIVYPKSDSIVVVELLGDLEISGVFCYLLTSLVVQVERSGECVAVYLLVSGQ